MPDGSRSHDPHDARDPAALAAVYRAHSAYVWRVLRHCGVPDSDLDDAVQETFLVVFRRLPEFRARASLRTWIYAIAVRVASTRRRSQRRETARREAAGDRMHGSPTVDPESALARTEAAALVDRLLEQLDASKRTVFVLAEIEGVKVPEISRILGVNPRTVHSRLRLARESFGSALRREQAREQGALRVARLRPRALLEHAANDRPPASRRKAAWAALAVRLEPGAVPTLPGWESVALPSSASAWLGPAVVLGAVGAMAVAVAVTGPVDRGHASSSVEPSATPTRPHHDEHARAPRTTAMPAVPEPPATASTTPLVPEPSTPDSSTPVVPEPPTPDSAQIAPHDDERARAPRPRAPKTDAAATDPASTLAAETRLLEQARSALRHGDPHAALAALDDHLAAFPQGLLLDEARSTRLRALCVAGRPVEAAALADRLAPGRSDSRWHHVVTAACQ